MSASSSSSTSLDSPRPLEACSCSCIARSSHSRLGGLELNSSLAVGSDETLENDGEHEFEAALGAPRQAGVDV